MTDIDNTTEDNITNNITILEKMITTLNDRESNDKHKIRELEQFIKVQDNIIKELQDTINQYITTVQKYTIDATCDVHALREKTKAMEKKVEDMKSTLFLL